MMIEPKKKGMRGKTQNDDEERATRPTTVLLEGFDFRTSTGVFLSVRRVVRVSEPLAGRNARHSFPEQASSILLVIISPRFFFFFAVFPLTVFPATNLCLCVQLSVYVRFASQCVKGRKEKERQEKLRERERKPAQKEMLVCEGKKRDRLLFLCLLMFF